METPKRSTPLKQVTPLSAHYAEPTHASSAKAKQAAGGTPTCGRSVECSSPALTFAEQRARRQSVEVSFFIYHITLVLQHFKNSYTIKRKHLQKVSISQT